MKKNFRKWMFVMAAVLVVSAVSVGGGVAGARLFGGNDARDSSNLQSVTFGTRDAMALPVLLTSAADTEVSRSFQNQFRAVASAALPVVVEVNIENTVTQGAAGSPFDFFFGTPRQSDPQQREFTQRGMGSGVVVARDGEIVYVLTNNHVAGAADSIEVVLNDGRSYTASLVGGDEMMDLALVSFTTPEVIPIAVLGDSESLVVGDWVFAVGNPLGFQSTVTAGIVSAKSRNPEPGSGMAGVTAYIQTDAAINQGNSGGALVNLDGEVVGINTWIASQTGGNIGLGFAIPINDARRAITDFISNGSISYSWLGVQTGSSGTNLATDLGIADLDGAFVFGVYEDSPAGAGGILPGDVVTKVGDTLIEDSNSLVRSVAAITPGDRVRFEVVRGGETIDLTIRTARRDASSGSNAASLWPGVTVAPMNDEIRQQLSLDNGRNGVAIVAVTPESVAANTGLQQGDTITEINGARISNAGDFYREINKDDGDVEFRIIRGGHELTLGFARPSN